MTTAFAATAVTNDEGVFPGLKAKLYTLQLPDSWTAAGVAWDLTADFTYVYGMIPLGVDAVADAAYKYSMECDGSTAATSSNTKVVAHYSTDAAGAMTAVPDSTDLSAVGKLSVMVLGK